MNVGQPIRVLFVSTDASSVVGIGPSFLNLVAGVDRTYIVPLAICPRPAKTKNVFSIVPELQQLDIPVFTRHIDLWLISPNRWGARHAASFLRNLRSRVWSFARLIQDHNIDLVYTNALTCLDAAIAAKMCGRPHVWHIRECISRNPDLKGYLPAPLIRRIVGALSAGIVVNSQYLARQFRRNPCPVHVVHNGVDLVQFAPRERTGILHRELGLEASSRLIGIVGTVAPRKGHDTFLQAAKVVHSHRQDVHFVIIGRGLPDYLQSMQGLAKKLQIAGHVHFLGARSDVTSILQDLDILVLASRQETFGRVLVEAMAAAKPVVATRCGGPEEIVIDDETGYLVPIDAPREMSKRLLGLLSSSELCSRLGQAGRQRAIEHFSVEQYAHKVQQIILDVAGFRYAGSALIDTNSRKECDL